MILVEKRISAELFWFLVVAHRCSARIACCWHFCGWFMWQLCVGVACEELNQCYNSCYQFLAKWADRSSSLSAIWIQPPLTLANLTAKDAVLFKSLPIHKMYIKTNIYKRWIILLLSPQQTSRFFFICITDLMQTAPTSSDNSTFPFQVKCNRSEI